MFKTCCGDCGECWYVGNPRTCTCPDETTKRTWVGLTDEDKESFWTADQMSPKEWDELYVAVEAKLKQKNGYAEEKNT